MSLQEKINKANHILNQYNIQLRYMVTLGEKEAKISLVVKNNNEKLNIGLFRTLQNENNEVVFYCGKIDSFYAKEKSDWDNYINRINQLEKYLNELNFLLLPYTIEEFKEELL